MIDPYAQDRAISHFCKRALERHGLMLKRQEVADIRDQIFSRKAQFLRWSEGEGFRSFYRVKIYGDCYIILYDLSIDSPVTIYHNSWFKFEDGVWKKRFKHKNLSRRNT